MTPAMLLLAGVACSAVLVTRLQELGRSTTLDRGLIAAVDHRNSATVKKLLAEGADPNAREEAWLNGRVSIRERIAIYWGRALGNHLYQNPPILLNAVVDKDRATTAALTDGGADVDEEGPAGQTALMLAAQAGDVALVKLLLQHAASVNQADDDGRTAILYTLYCSDGADGTIPAIVRPLIAAGARVDVRSAGGETVLTLARDRHRPDLVRFFQSLVQC